MYIFLKKIIFFLFILKHTVAAVYAVTKLLYAVQSVIALFIPD